jgi:large subunit ribosomal protein L21
MNYAILSLQGHQYQVQEGQELTVDKLSGEPGEQLTLDQVLLSVNNDQRQLGQPYVENAQVKAKILEQFKGKKIRVATYKAKSRYRRVKGHRSLLTKLLIEKIKT